MTEEATDLADQLLDEPSDEWGIAGRKGTLENWFAPLHRLPALPSKRLSVVDASDRPRPTYLVDWQDVGEIFAEKLDEWQRETWFVSSFQDSATNDAYQSIIGLGRQAIPFILQRLDDEGPYWFWALRHIVDEDPADGIDDPTAAIEAWRSWARLRGYLAEQSGT